MLTEIHIRDLVTIEELHLDLQFGSTMITGETGAGKSIFIEAIELALGARSSIHHIRQGKERAEITLCFNVMQLPAVTAWLKKHDLFQDTHECIIRRTITQDGRSRSYINGLPSTQQAIRELSELLFHLHGQHEQQVLLKTENQRDLLDRYAGHLPLVNEVKNLGRELKSLNEEIIALRAKMLERYERMNDLRFQLDELSALSLQEGEWETLEAEHRQLTHTQEWIYHLQRSISLLTEIENGNALALLREARKSLEATVSIHVKAAAWVNTLDSILIQLDELETDLRYQLEKGELNPDRLHYVEQRISQAFSLARKHQITPSTLIQFQEQINAELNTLETGDHVVLQLEEQKKHLEAKYTELANLLNANRKKAAHTFSAEITSTIRSLSLPHAAFHIDVTEEKITFLLKTNPDQAIQPLAKVISGGELSRLSLAVHLALAHQTISPTLIFDEVDTGIGGATAERIGKLVQALGKSYQVFCVTHQPQVAACGHHHLLVEKYYIDSSTHTRLRVLNADEKTAEIARMLAGEKITEKTLAHAEELLLQVE